MLPMMGLDQQRFVITLLPHKGHFLFFLLNLFFYVRQKQGVFDDVQTVQTPSSLLLFFL